MSAEWFKLVQSASADQLEAFIQHRVATTAFDVNECNANDSEGRAALHYIVATLSHEQEKEKEKEEKEVVDESGVLLKIRTLVRFGGNVNVPQQRDRSTALHCVARLCDSLVIFQTLIRDYGADVTLCDVAGDSPLHVASRWGRVELVRYLIGELKVDVNAVNRAGHQALHLAAAWGHDDVVFALVALGADIGATREKDGATLMHWAAERGLDDGVERLFALGADVDAQTVEGRTPIFWAVKGGQSATLNRLVALGANIEARDTFASMTPLHFAALLNRPLCAIKLVALGADVCARDAFLFTPLHYAARESSDDDALLCDALLEAAGARRDELMAARNTAGRTAIELAPPRSAARRCMALLCADVSLRNANLGDLSAAMLTFGDAVRSVDLRDNPRLTTIPTSLALLDDAAVRRIDIDVTSMRGEARAIARAGDPRAIVQYARALRDGALIKMRHMQLMLVGEAAAGKTSLARALAAGSDQFSARTVSTDGIDEICVELGGVHLSMLDFGGQTIYKATHQLFLSASNAIYMLVFRLHEPADRSAAELGFWLDSIRARVPRPCVILVATHADRVKHADERRAAMKRVLAALQKRFGDNAIRRAVVVSCCAAKPRYRREIDELRALVAELAVERLVRAPALVDQARTALDILLSQRAQRAVAPPIVSLGRACDAIAEHCRHCNTAVPSRVDLRTALATLHALGIVVVLRRSRAGSRIGSVSHVPLASSSSVITAASPGDDDDDDDDDGDNNGIVVLRRQWLAQLLATIVTTRRRPCDDDGVLMHAALAEIWADAERYPPQHHADFVALLRQAGVLFPLTADDVDISQACSLVPPLLPEAPSARQRFFWPPGAKSSVVKRKLFRLNKAESSATSFPIDLVPTLLQHLLASNRFVARLCWQRGFIMQMPSTGGGGGGGGDDDDQALVRVELVCPRQALVHVGVRKRAKSLRVAAAAMRSICSMLRTLLLDCFEGVRFDVLVPHRVADDDSAVLCSVELGALLRGGASLACSQGHRMESSDDARRRLAPDEFFEGLELIDGARLVEQSLLGVGAFGRVTLCLLDSERQVAVKHIVVADQGGESGDTQQSSNGNASSPQSVEARWTEMADEVWLMSSLSHRNIVSLVGVSLQPSAALVMRLMPGGELYAQLNDPLQINELVRAHEAAHKLVCSRHLSSIFGTPRDSDGRDDSAMVAAGEHFDRWNRMLSSSSRSRSSSASSSSSSLPSSLLRTELAELRERYDLRTSMFCSDASDKGADDALRQVIDDVKILGRRHGLLLAPIDWPLRLKLAVDIACGMRYLHSLEPPIIHRDLKSVSMFSRSSDSMRLASN
jgi:ankyrin repeat protein/GTPase SAR1 family protein